MDLSTSKSPGVSFCFLFWCFVLCVKFRYSKRRRKSETICERRCQKGSEGCLCGSGQGDDQVKEGCEQALRIQSSHELCAHEYEEPAR